MNSVTKKGVMACAKIISGFGEKGKQAFAEDDWKNLQHLFVPAFLGSDLLSDTTAGERTVPNQPVFPRQGVPE